MDSGRDSVRRGGVGDAGDPAPSPGGLRSREPDVPQLHDRSSGQRRSCGTGIVFLDATLAVGLPTIPVQNVDDERPIYASVSELAQLLRVNATQTTRRADAGSEGSRRRDRPRDRDGRTSTGRDSVLQPSGHRPRGRTSNEPSSTGGRSSPRSGSSASGDAESVYTARDSWDQARPQARRTERLLGDGVSVALMMDALAEQIQEELAARPIRSSRICRSRTGCHPNPTPPAIDIYPSLRSPRSSATGPGTSTGSPSGPGSRPPRTKAGAGSAAGDDGC